MRRSLAVRMFRFSQACLAAAAFVLVVPASGYAQTETEEGAPPAAGAPTGGDTTGQLKGAAGVGASKGAEEAAKGGGYGDAAKKGGAAGVQEYMKPQGAGAGAAAAPKKADTDEDDGGDEGDTEE